MTTEAKRKANRRRYERIKSDPELLEKERERQRLKNARYRQDPEKLELYRESSRKAHQKRRSDPAHLQRIQVRGKISSRIQSKRIPRPQVFTCCDCEKEPAVEYHHEDYSIWWLVEALCRPCHERRHHH